METRLALCLAVAASVAQTLPAANQHNDYVDPPFSYRTAEKHDPFTLLQREIREGRVQLRGGSPTVFLRSLLEKLKIPAESQTLVFSKTAFQRKVVSSDNLRAVYFSDDVYLTYIPGGRIEIASTDPTLGSVFSIFDPTGGPGLPKIESPGSCLGCHAGSFTNFLPGPMLRTVVSDAEGRVVFDYPENNRGHAVKFEERWGSWIVKGAPPEMGHLGNVVAVQKDGKWEKSGEKFATDVPVEEFCRKCDLPAMGSDVVALLVLDHQVAAHNKIIDAGYRWRHAVDKAGKPLLTGDALDEAKEWTRNLQHYLTFGDEAPLPAPVRNAASAFSKAFSTAGTLRELKLDGHLFRNRLSYMVHGLSFTGWPVEYQHFFWNELKAAFQAKTVPKEFAHLSASERENILTIVRATVKGLPTQY